MNRSNNRSGKSAENNPEYFEVTTGGPKKYFRRKLIRNPLYQPPRPIREPKIKEKWYRDLLQELRSARLRKKLTQKQLGKLIGANQGWVSLFELGKTNPTLGFLLRLAKVLGLKASVIINKS